jgi:methyltransferase (TIGR00027 family)
MSQVISHVSDTAFMVAGFRALETERPDALFRDPLAAKLSGEQGRNILTTIPRRFVGAWSVVIRTVIIDAFIQEAIADGVDTILNLGAGLDTRPYRMALPKSLRWIEVDYPHVIELKQTRLADEHPQCGLDRVKLDLTDRAARRQLFAEVNAGATGILVLTEGVIPYLAEHDVAELAADLRQMDRARCWVIDYFSPEALKFGRRMRARVLRNAPFRFEPKDWFGFFASHGWQAKEVRYIVEEADRLNRPIPLHPVMKAWMVLRVLFASRARREAMKHFAGYVLLVPN